MTAKRETQSPIEESFPTHAEIEATIRHAHALRAAALRNALGLDKPAGEKASAKTPLGGRRPAVA